jgi:CheY-like chemotaxis protein
MMVMMLRKLGYELLVASNGRECIEIVERERLRGPAHEIDVILMDASMDIMNGLDATEQIRREQKKNSKRPYIITQTASVSEEFKQKCLAAGADDFIGKPIRIEALVTSLENAYKQTHYGMTTPASLKETTATSMVSLVQSSTILSDKDSFNIHNDSTHLHNFDISNTSSGPPLTPVHKATSSLSDYVARLALDRSPSL